MLIHARQDGHVASFPGIAHAIVSINANGTFNCHVYVGEALKSASCNLVPSENALEAVAANVKAAAEHVISHDAVKAAIKAHDDMLRSS